MSTIQNQNTSPWKKILNEKLTPEFHQAIDAFETTLTLKKQGKVDDKVFAETRLRLGAYGQRYDNGHRYDGETDRTIPFPTRNTKGPDTEWDAPGMQRIKIPYGGLTTAQMEELANIAEEYSDDILHITTRQDFQLHYVHIEDTPDIFRRLASVGITTQEACGNTIRNITACPYIGVCQNESFDVTPYADATFKFLLGHPDCQNFGRKMKISFSGCSEGSCGLGYMHDIGFVAQKRMHAGKEEHGFKVLVGGGLGAVPMQAKVFDEFMPANDILKFCQATARVFAKFGEKKNRNRARMKFIVNDWGIEKFCEVVLEEIKTMPASETKIEEQYSPDIGHRTSDVGQNAPTNSDYKSWTTNNVRPQRQTGYFTATISLPLGDISAAQMRKLAPIARKYCGDNIRTTVEQNLVLRWVRETDLLALYEELKKIQLAESDYGTIKSIVSCPGTDTCKLGISSSRGLAAELRSQIDAQKIKLPESAQNLDIKISGCFNSCGQHHIADIGFYGVGRKVGNAMVPFFQLILGGSTKNNAETYGLAAMAIPSKSVPKALERLTQYFDKNRTPNEDFQSFIARQGKIDIKNLLSDLLEVPSYESAPSYYTDWGDVRSYSKRDIGMGECAGEVVSTTDFALTTAEREVFEAQVALDEKKLDDAYAKAFAAMLSAATGLVREVFQDAPTDFESIKKAFQTRFIDTKIFLDRFSGDKFARFFTEAKIPEITLITQDKAHHFIEEAQLFIEACHSYQAKKLAEIK